MISNDPSYSLYTKAFDVGHYIINVSITKQFTSVRHILSNIFVSLGYRRHTQDKQRKQKHLLKLSSCWYTYTIINIIIIIITIIIVIINNQ